MILLNSHVEVDHLPDWVVQVHPSEPHGRTGHIRIRGTILRQSEGPPSAQPLLRNGETDDS